MNSKSLLQQTTDIWTRTSKPENKESIHQNSFENIFNKASDIWLGQEQSFQGTGEKNFTTAETSCQQQQKSTNNTNQLSISSYFQSGIMTAENTPDLKFCSEEKQSQSIELSKYSENIHSSCHQNLNQMQQQQYQDPKILDTKQKLLFASSDINPTTSSNARTNDTSNLTSEDFNNNNFEIMKSNNNILNQQYQQLLRPKAQSLKLKKQNSSSSSLQESQQQQTPLKKNLKFTPKEDALLLQKIQEIGKKWQQLAKFFPERSSLMIRNRYYSKLRGLIKKSGNSSNNNFQQGFLSDGKSFSNNNEESSYQSQNTPDLKGLSIQEYSSSSELNLNQNNQQQQLIQINQQQQQQINNLYLHQNQQQQQTQQQQVDQDNLPIIQEEQQQQQQNKIVIEEEEDLFNDPPMIIYSSNQNNNQNKQQIMKNNNNNTSIFETENKNNISKLNNTLNLLNDSASLADEAADMPQYRQAYEREEKEQGKNIEKIQFLYNQIQHIEDMIISCKNQIFSEVSKNQNTNKNQINQSNQNQNYQPQNTQQQQQNSLQTNQDNQCGWQDQQKQQQQQQDEYLNNIFNENNFDLQQEFDTKYQNNNNNNNNLI